jgi:hypothetical protein
MLTHVYTHIKSHKIAVRLIYFSHFHTPQTNTSPIGWRQVILRLTLYIFIAFITKCTSCHSVRRFSTNVSDCCSILSLTAPHSSSTKIHPRSSFETSVFIKRQDVTHIREQYSFLTTVINSETLQTIVNVIFILFLLY